ncbi:hypothetical protein Taro_045979 [Colocasia esculenta]|uniref:Retrotransposon gag domain-containing protein n=1 Tax=Colocasia esculenta TaxID=4460 RepID=A0A843X4Z8_COLES|nr:hypothetical protein [Colocasia esculenta]
MPQALVLPFSFMEIWLCKLVEYIYNEMVNLKWLIEEIRVGGGDDPKESTQRMIERIWESLTDIRARMDQQAPAVPVAPVSPRVEVPFAAPVPPPPPVLLAEEPVMQVEKFLRLQPPTYSGGLNPDTAEHWVHEIERVFVTMRCPAADRVVLAAYQLRGFALEWWRLKMQTTFAGRTEEAITWSEFLDTEKEAHQAELESHKKTKATTAQLVADEREKAIADAVAEYRKSDELKAEVVKLFRQGYDFCLKRVREHFSNIDVSKAVLDEEDDEEADDDDWDESIAAVVDDSLATAVEGVLEAATNDVITDQPTAPDSEETHVGIGDVVVN